MGVFLCCVGGLKKISDTKYQIVTKIPKSGENGGAFAVGGGLASFKVSNFCILLLYIASLRENLYKYVVL